MFSMLKDVIQTSSQTLGFSLAMKHVEGENVVWMTNIFLWQEHWACIACRFSRGSFWQRPRGGRARLGSPCWPCGGCEMMNCAGCRLAVGCTSTNCCRFRFCCWRCCSCCRSWKKRPKDGLGILIKSLPRPKAPGQAVACDIAERAQSSFRGHVSPLSQAPFFVGL